MNAVAANDRRTGGRGCMTDGGSRGDANRTLDGHGPWSANAAQTGSRQMARIHESVIESGSMNDVQLGHVHESGFYFLTSTSIVTLFSKASVTLTLNLTSSRLKNDHLEH